jgi:hypothetical protein
MPQLQLSMDSVASTSDAGQLDVNKTVSCVGMPHENGFHALHDFSYVFQTATAPMMDNMGYLSSKSSCLQQKFESPHLAWHDTVECPQKFCYKSTGKVYVTESRSGGMYP